MTSLTVRDVGLQALRLVALFWPLWLFWFALHCASVFWVGFVLSPRPVVLTPTYRLLSALRLSASLLGPIIAMVGAVSAYRFKIASRWTAIAGVVAVGLATLITISPAWARLAPYVGHTPPGVLIKALDPGVLWAFALGVLACGFGIRGIRGDRSDWRGAAKAEGVSRAPSGNFGHADWLDLKALQARFPGPDPAFGGIVVGEAYRVDLDHKTRGRPGRATLGPVEFDPADQRTWGLGGSAPLLVDPCRSGPTHALVLAGSGGFKTTSIGLPTLLTWTASAVVLDPSREVGPMVSAYRQRALGQKVMTLDPGDPKTAAFNVLDWIDITSPLAESNVEAVATWLVGEPARGVTEGGAEFFRDMGKTLITCILADVLWNEDEKADKTLRRVRQVLVTPEKALRKDLTVIHETSPSPLARDLAGTLMGIVDDTFSGVYANANRATRWLSIKAYSDLVSGKSFSAADLTGGDLTVFVQIPLKVLQSTPGLGRVVIGALLNAAYEADGKVQGRILFLLDEVARLGPMGAIETARDAGRKYGITLLLLYQSVGQLLEQWGREGARAWYDSTSWRLYAAVQDPETARELASVCGEHGVMATSHGDTAGTSRRGLLASHNNSGQSENRSELKRSLIKPDELLQDTRSDEAFVIVRGSRPIRCGRAIFFRRPEMVAAVEPSRFYGGRSPIKMRGNEG